jgi:hypothetical protein
VRWIAIALLMIVPSYASAAACLWFADGQTIKRVDTAENTVAAQTALAAPRRLVMNDTDCSVWALRNANGRLLKFDPSGAQVRSVNLLALDSRLDASLRIRLDPFDDSLWVTGERRIVHLDADASTVLAAFNAPADIRRFRIGLDQKLWVLGKRKLWRFNRQGVQIDERLLDSVLRDEARYFEVDELRETIWIAGETQVARIGPAGVPPVPAFVASSFSSGLPTIVAQVPDGTTGFALDPVSGRVWVGRVGSIEGFNSDGSPYASINLAAAGFSGLNKLRFDPASRSLWAGFEQKLVRFSDTGQLVAVIPAADYDDEAVGVPPFRVRPRVALEQPPENGLVNRRRPIFEMPFGARCNGTDCDVPQSYATSLQAWGTLNGDQVGGDFEIDSQSRVARFRPANQLPQGPAAFSARLTDGFGHRSNQIDTVITVDTIAPEFGTIRPVAGTTVSDPLVNLRGTISEVGSAVMLENAPALGAQGPNPQYPQAPDLKFSWQIALQPGENQIRLSAVDPAGNVATTTHTLTLLGSGGMPLVSIQSPQAGGTLADDSAIVSGTWAGPANTGITVNGVVAGVSGNQFFATVPLAAGLNTLNVVAKTGAGVQATASVQVTSSGASATRVTASPVQGLVPLQASFTIVSDRPIESVEGNFAVGYRICGEGCFEPGKFSVTWPSDPLGFTYDKAGAYEALFNIRHTDGTLVTRSLRIVGQREQDIDAAVRAAWTGFSTALAARDKPAALAQLVPAAQARYTPVLDALEASLPSIASALSALQRAVTGASAAEYFVTRPGPNGSQAFLVYFTLDADGVWKLEGL